MRDVRPTKFVASASSLQYIFAVAESKVKYDCKAGERSTVMGYEARIRKGEASVDGSFHSCAFPTSRFSAIGNAVVNLGKTFF